MAEAKKKGRPRKYRGGYRLLTVSIGADMLKELDEAKEKKGMSRGEFIWWLYQRAKERGDL